MGWKYTAPHAANGHGLKPYRKGMSVRAVRRFQFGSMRIRGWDEDDRTVYIIRGRGVFWNIINCCYNYWYPNHHLYSVVEVYFKLILLKTLPIFFLGGGVGYIAS